MLLRHTIGYSLARGIPGIFSFLAIVAFSRLLDPAEYGIYALALGTIQVINVVAFQWLGLGLLRHWSLVSDRLQLWNTVAKIAAFITVALLAVGGSVALFQVDGNSKVVVGISVLALCFYGWFEILLQESRARLAPARYGLLNAIKTTCWLAVGVGLAHQGFGAAGALGGLLTGLVLACLVGGITTGFPDGRVPIDRRLLKSLLSYGLPLSGTLLLGYIIGLSDRYILAWLQGEETAGLYAVGYDLPRQTLGMLMMAVNLAAFPLATRALDQGGPDRAREQLQKNGSILLLVAVPAATGLIVLAPQISNAVVGGRFAASTATLLPWIAASALLEGFKSYYLDHSFHLAKASTVQLKTVAIIAGANIVLNLVLIPVYGMMGAAYATLASFAFGVIVTMVQTRRVFRVAVPWRNLGKAITASSTMGLTLIGINRIGYGLPVYVSIVVGVVLYSLVVVILNPLGIRESLVQRLVGSVASRVSHR